MNLLFRDVFQRRPFEVVHRVKQPLVEQRRELLELSCSGSSGPDVLESRVLPESWLDQALVFLLFVVFLHLERFESGFFVEGGQSI
jgi:hypothetical protein